MLGTAIIVFREVLEAAWSSASSWRPAAARLVATVGSQAVLQPGASALVSLPCSPARSPLPLNGTILFLAVGMLG